jgi:DNA-binding protein HU-beta
MTKAEMIERVCKTKGLPPTLTKKAVITIIDAAFGTVGDYFVRSRFSRNSHPRFTYPGFGTFVKRRREARRGRNPQTGQPLVIPESFTITFAPSSDLKADLNRHRRS